MSKNFEMLQQLERSRNLFQSAAALPTLHTPQAIPEEAAPEKRGAEEPASNSHHLVAASPSWSVELFRWLASLLTGTQRFRVRSNDHTPYGRSWIDRKTMALEEETKLVERVFFGPDSGSNKVILFSGVDNAKGAARVCARAAETLAAQIQGSVCVVDADLQSHSLEHHLRARNTPGLFEAVLEKAPIRRYVQQLASSNLWMITSGAGEANSRIPLNSERVRIRFEELRTQFDYILINAPSMGMTANLTLLGQLAHGVIFVVEANSTRRETTKQLKESLEEAQVRVLGVVLNGRTFPIPESIYRKL